MQSIYMYILYLHAFFLGYVFNLLLRKFLLHLWNESNYLNEGKVYSFYGTEKEEYTRKSKIVYSYFDETKTAKLDVNKVWQF